MDKFLKPCAKRAADAVADARGTIAAAPPKRLKTGPTTFLYVKPSRDVVEVLETMGTVVTFTEFKTWPNSMPNNITKLEAAAIKASEHGPVVLVGTSFGCRVVAGLLAKRGAAWADKAILVSYPLYGDSAKAPERVSALTRVHVGTKLLFHSGSKDEFLDRSGWRGAGAPTGAAALKAVLAESGAVPTYSIVDGARHGSCSSKKAKEQFRASVAVFLSEPAAPDAAAPAAPPVDVDAVREARLARFDEPAPAKDEPAPPAAEDAAPPPPRSDEPAAGKDAAAPIDLT